MTHEQFMRKAMVALARIFALNIVNFDEAQRGQDIADDLQASLEEVVEKGEQ